MKYVFSIALRALMKERNLNQLQLAKILGCRQSLVHNWLYEKSVPTYYSLKILCDKLDIDIKEFFD